MHPKKGKPKNAPVTRARANTSTTADTAGTCTGAASTSGGVEHKVDHETQSTSPSYTTADTMSTGAEAASSSGGLEHKTASTGAKAASTSGGMDRKKLQVLVLTLQVHLVAWSVKVRVKQVSTMQILSAK